VDSERIPALPEGEVSFESHQQQQQQQHNIAQPITRACSSVSSGIRQTLTNPSFHKRNLKNRNNTADGGFSFLFSTFLKEAIK
jgi:hypothetical protein